MGGFLYKILLFLHVKKLAEKILDVRFLGGTCALGRIEMLNAICYVLSERAR